uniref:V-set and transmembrane domain-containing protein 2-like protein n=1 Tax=Gallus gallus TaxID=9031 RepID=A0A8V0YLX0_CHICK
MGALGLAVGIFHYLGLYLQLGAASRPPPWDAPAEGSALFTEMPHDVTAQAGEDVEMACSFRGSGSPSYSLEIQWWYVRTHKDWTDKQTWASGQQLKASQQEEAGKDATKISVVKVVGSNISHKLRLSRVKPADEGTYECRVIDASEGTARQHKGLYILPLPCLPHSRPSVPRLEPSAGRMVRGGGGGSHCHPTARTLGPHHGALPLGRGLRRGEGLGPYCPHSPLPACTTCS